MSRAVRAAGAGLAAALLVGAPVAAQQAAPGGPSRPARPAPAAPAPTASVKAVPAQADRTATIAILDKRSGEVTDVTVAPGGGFRVGRLVGTLRSCDVTPPHLRREQAAYLELALEEPARAGRQAPRVRPLFAGWMFAESPSLNPLADPVYDVWLRACTIRAPVGPSAAVPTGPKAAQSASAASASARSPR